MNDVAQLFSNLTALKHIFQFGNANHPSVGGGENEIRFAGKTAIALSVNINKLRSRGAGRHRRSIPIAMGEDINQK